MAPANPTSAADAAFVDLAARVVESMIEADPEGATQLGDHRYDDRLTDRGPAALVSERAVVGRALDELDAVDDSALSVGNRVDAEILRSRLRERAFAIDVLRETTWDPLVWNPGTALYSLLARDFAPLGDRLRSLAGRLGQVPELLDTARRTLEDMPRVHVETAVGQFTGTRALLTGEVDRALDQEPSLRGELQPVREAAVAALDEHLRWLEAALPGADRDPRVGAEVFAAKLGHALDTVTPADAVLDRAEAELVTIEEEIAETAGRLSGERAPDASTVRRVLDRLAATGQVSDATIVGLCEAALVETRAFVEAQQLVTVHDDPVQIIVMPEIHRGVAVAYCDPPGPLESAPLPTYFAVSPTPADWPPERVASFYREYNAHMLHGLTVHEAMPGHVLQLSHSARLQAQTPVRKAFWSGSFVEGWAVYAEELMVRSGYRADRSDLGGDGGDALRMQQLKMQLRMTINAILDARVHAHGMTEDEAMRLMTRRGYQEEGEAAGKWRRALLSSAQLSTYFVGYTEVSDLARDLAAARPELSLRERHDAMLAHGSPPARHLRTLLAADAE